MGKSREAFIIFSLILFKLGLVSQSVQVRIRVYIDFTMFVTFWLFDNQYIEKIISYNIDRYYQAFKVNTILIRTTILRFKMYCDWL